MRFLFLDKMITDVNNPEKILAGLLSFEEDLSSIRAYSVTVEELRQLADDDSYVKDFYVNGSDVYARTDTVRVLDPISYDIVIHNDTLTLYDVLLDLAKKRAYYIPEFCYIDKNSYSAYKMYNCFTNLRVSDSSMFVGISILGDKGWFSDWIVKADDKGFLIANTFYVALPPEIPLSVECEKTGEITIDGRLCNVYHCDGSLSLTPWYQPSVPYCPSYINFLYFMCIALRTAKEILSDLVEYEPEEVQQLTHPELRKFKSVSMRSNFKVPGKKRRLSLLKLLATCEFKSEEEMFMRLQLEPHEEYAMSLVSSLDADDLASSAQSLLPSIKTSYLKFAFELYKIRSVIFREDKTFPNGMTDQFYGGQNKFVSTLTKSGGQQ